MSVFDAGALVFKIQTVGAAVFRQEQRQAQSEFDKTGQSAGKAAESISKTGTETDKTGQASEIARPKMRSLGQEFRNLDADSRATLNSIGAGLTVFGSAVVAVGVAAAKTGVEYNTLQQTSRAALTTLLGSAEAANEQMDKLDAFARTSPFSKAVFIQAQQQLLGFGMTAERVVPTLEAIQNAVAATGGSNDDIRELVRIIAQLAGGVKISAETFNQFGARGIDAATLIGEAMGKTGQQIRDEVTEGTLDADAAIQALTDGMQKRFAGAAAGVKDTFSGAMDRLSAAWRDFSAELATPLVDPDGGGGLIDLLNWAADMMRWFMALPEPIKVTTTAVVGLTGAVTLAGGVFLLAAPKVIKFRQELAFLTYSMPQTMSAMQKVQGFLMGPWGIAIAAATAGLMWFATQQAEAAAKSREFADAIEQGEEATRGYIATLLTADRISWGQSIGSMADDAEHLGISLDLLRGAIEGHGDSAALVEAKLREYTDTTGTMTGEMARNELVANRLRGEIETLNARYERGIEITEQKARADGEVTSSTQAVSEAYAEQQAVIDGLTTKLSELVDEIDDANSAGQNAVTANAKWQEALADLTNEVEKNGTSLDQATVAGSANAATLADLASKAQNAAEKQYELDKQTMSVTDATRAYIGTLEQQRIAFIESAVEAGYNREEVEKLAEQIFILPDEKAIKLIAETEEASRRLDVVYQTWNGRTITFNAALNERIAGVTSYGGITSADGNLIESYANGGVRENHVAQMARAGAWRVWAEPETGGESYVPHAPSKRARSEQIMAETAAILGGLYIPSGAAQYAGGGAAATTSMPPEGFAITGTLEIGGDGLARLINGHLVQAFPSEGAVHSQFAR